MAPSNWWMYHGDPGHTGRATGSNINSTNVGTLVTKDVPIPGPVLSVPAIVDGFVYVGIANNHDLPGANGGAILKISCATGQIQPERFEWQLNPNNPSDTSGEDSHGFTGMGCTPAITGGKIYFSGFNGVLYCLDQQTLKLVWYTDLRHADITAPHNQNQPVANTMSDRNPQPPYPPAAGWSSPVVANGRVYVGIGEGENPSLFGFVYCLDAQTGKVIWLYCLCENELGTPNAPNVIPPGTWTAAQDLPAPFSVMPSNPDIRGCSPWASLAYDPDLKRIYCATGNPNDDAPLPTAGLSNSVVALDAQTGAYIAHFQPPASSSYRNSDADVDFGGSPILFSIGGRKVVAAGCKNGGFFVLDATTLEVVAWRQLLPFYNDGTQIPSVDPHVSQYNAQPNPRVPNAESDYVDQENYSATYSTPAILPDATGTGGTLFTGVGGNNYHLVAPGIDYETTPFLRAMRWDTPNLADAWPMDDNNPPNGPRRYANAIPPMYTTPGESGLSSPATVNDVVFCSTSFIAVYAFEASTGKLLWSDQTLGQQTGGFNGGYGYCMGPAISGNYVAAGALVMGGTGGVLRIYSLPTPKS